jgi:hypothetical protein
LYLASDVIWFCKNFEKTFQFGEVPQTVAAVQKDLLDYYIEEAVETGEPHEFVVLVEGAIIVQFAGSPPQAYHMDVLYPHYQVGGVWTENSLTTMEYQVVGQVVHDVETLEAALQDVHGCEKMPADLKKLWKGNKDFNLLISLYGKLLSKDIVKVPDGQDNPVPVGSTFVLPGSFIHAGPPCPKDTAEIWITMFGCLSLSGSKALDAVAKITNKEKKPREEKNSSTMTFWITLMQGANWIW